MLLSQPLFFVFPLFPFKTITAPDARFSLLLPILTPTFRFKAGGIELLERLMRELPELLQRNTELLTESERMLTEEKDSDDKLRNQYKVCENDVCVCLFVCVIFCLALCASP